MAFCCEQFNVDCPQANVQPVSPQMRAVRRLYETCYEQGTPCAAGLECREGKCRHPVRVINPIFRAQVSEAQNELDMDSGSDVEGADPVPNDDVIAISGPSAPIGNKPMPDADG